MHAHQLLNRTLKNNWKVVARPDLGPAPTGGGFSVGYIVENDDGRRGFLKAMDYSSAFQTGQSPADKLLELSSTYKFERDLCKKCKEQAMDRVVHAIDDGTIEVLPGNPYSNVDYLIFELANGDIRKILDTQQSFDTAFALRALHHTAVGLRQMHASNMAHQDLKPSNVLVFDDIKGSRIADLGRAWSKDMSSPHDTYRIAGAQPYAPPEFILGAIPVEENNRRFGCDLYLLGSLICFIFTRTTTNGLLFARMANGNRVAQWTGSYSAYLPYLQAAFAEALEEFAGHVDDLYRYELVEMVKQLCDPDPDRRGHPLDRKGNQFSLERYISRLNLLAYRAETRLIRGDV